jgi:hypothetical protein
MGSWRPGSRPTLESFPTDRGVCFWASLFSVCSLSRALRMEENPGWTRDVFSIAFSGLAWFDVCGEMQPSAHLQGNIEREVLRACDVTSPIASRTPEKPRYANHTGGARLARCCRRTEAGREHMSRILHVSASATRNFVRAEACGLASPHHMLHGARRVACISASRCVLGVGPWASRSLRLGTAWFRAPTCLLSKERTASFDHLASVRLSAERLDPCPLALRSVDDKCRKARLTSRAVE